MSRKSITIIRFLFLLLLLSVEGMKAQNQPKLVQTPPHAEELAPDGLECKVYCSPTKLRTPIAELTWVAADKSLDRQGLEVTVYKNGFEKGPFARLLLIERGQKFTLQKTPRYTSGGRTPGLDSLFITEVRTREDRLSQRSINIATVQVEGLEPGLNYYWRVVSKVSGKWLASKTVQAVRCQAPVCPADMQPETGKP